MSKKPYTGMEIAVYPSHGRNFRYVVVVSEDAYWTLKYEECQEGKWKMVSEFGMGTEEARKFAEAIVHVADYEDAERAKEEAEEPDKGCDMSDRYVCSADDPYDREKHGPRSSHPDAKCVGTDEGYGAGEEDYDIFVCPHCGIRLRE